MTFRCMTARKWRGDRGLAPPGWRQGVTPGGYPPPAGARGAASRRLLALTPRRGAHPPRPNRLSLSSQFKAELPSGEPARARQPGRAAAGPDRRGSDTFTILTPSDRGSRDLHPRRGGRIRSPLTITSPSRDIATRNSDRPRWNRVFLKRRIALQHCVRQFGRMIRSTFAYFRCNTTSAWVRS